MKENNESRNTWKNICVKGLKDLILLKCPDHPKLSTNLMQSLSK